MPAGFDEEVRCCKRESCFEQIHYSVKHGYESITTANVPATFHRVTAQPAIIGCAKLPALQALSASHLGDARTAARERYDAHSRHAASCEAGKVMWRVAPWGAFAVAQICPPCASTIERQIDSPMPMPLGLVE